jgi:uncharacterized membrane-anchored protein YjiN (DUF445 family)
MSVPAYKRSENAFQILTNAEKLYKEIIRISKTEKLIPKRYMKLLGFKIVEDARDVLESIAIANEMDLNDEYERIQRREYQKRTKIALIKMEQDIKINLEFVKSSIEKYETSLSLMSDIKKQLSNWIKSDFERE